MQRALTYPPVETLNLATLLQVLRRHQRWVVGSILVAGLLALVLGFTLTPLYKAELLLLLDPRSTPMAMFEDAAAHGLPLEPASVRTEMEIIQSPELIGRVIDQLHLLEQPDFQQALRQPAWLETMQRSVAGSAPANAEPNNPERTLRMKAIHFISRHLNVGNDGRNYTIKISVTAADPVRAAAIANAFGAAYLADQLQAKYQVTERAAAWLNDRLRGLQKAAEEDERAVQTFRAEKNLTHVGDRNLTDQAMLEINSQWVAAKAQLAQAEARLRAAQDANSSDHAVSDVLNSPLIQRLQEQESTVRRSVADLSSRYGEQHPRLIDARAQLTNITQKINEEVGKIIEALANEVTVARAKESSLAQALKGAQNKNTSHGFEEVTLHQLEREAEASRLVYEHFLTRYKQTSEAKSLAENDARIVSPAQIPVEPYFPNKALWLVGGLVLGGLVGAGIAFGRDDGDRSLHTAGQVVAQLGVPCFALVPALHPQPENPALPPASYQAALQRAITRLRLCPPASAAALASALPPRLVMLSAVQEDEGASAFSIAWARMAAHSGLQVLWVDANLRVPTPAKSFAASANPVSTLPLYDMADGMPGAVPAAVLRDSLSGMDYLPNQGSIADPYRLLNHPKFAAQLQHWRTMYDMVVVHSAPVLAAVDALLLSTQMDAVLVLACWGKTPRRLVQEAVQQLPRPKLAGVILHGVDTKRQGYYAEDEGAEGVETPIAITADSFAMQK